MNEFIKRSLLFALLLPCFFLLTCTPKTAYDNITTAETTFVESTASGLVTVKAIGYGTDFSLAHTDAVKRAFETILLRGLPHFTALRRPIVENESSLNNKHPDFLKNFFANDTYSQFITKQGETAVISELKKPKGVQISNIMTINYDGLRRYLEKEGIIRKFGY